MLPPNGGPQVALAAMSSGRDHKMHNFAGYHSFVFNYDDFEIRIQSIFMSHPCNSNMRILKQFCNRIDYPCLMYRYCIPDAGVPISAMR
jgi:hypothetical protein